MRLALCLSQTIAKCLVSVSYMYGLMYGNCMASQDIPGSKSRKLGWLPRLPEAGGPIYLALVDAMEADIRSGRLPPGQRMPPQRALAAALGIDLTTVTRAYGEARRRGLLAATVGRGTYVQGAIAADGGAESGEGRSPVDTTMNFPPQPPDARLGEHLADGLRAVLKLDSGSLLSYQASGGLDSDRAAGAAWLEPRLGRVPLDRLLICAGAQAGLLTILITIAAPGDLILAEALTYPRFTALAARLHLRARGVAMDGEGILPDSFEAACRAARPKALYCIPTMQNPTTATMSAERRAAIAEIARRFGVAIIEDDSYGFHSRHVPPPVASLAPDITYYVASLAKPVAPGLRIAYVVAPDVAAAAPLAAGIRCTTIMVPPVMAALASEWIRSGAARQIAEAVRRESAARQQLAARALSTCRFAAHPEAHHLWLSLPAGWTPSEFVGYMRPRGLAVVPSQVFAADDAPAPDAVRITLAAPKDRRHLQELLTTTAKVLAQPAAVWSSAG